MFDHDILEKLMAKAYHNALQSPDPSSQNGAVLVKRQPNGQLDIVANGYNHFYKGIPPEVEDRDKKLQGIEHAERDAIYNAASRGIETQGSILICPWAACYDCARAIMGSGCDALIYHKQRNALTHSPWVENVNEALTWIQNSGIYIFEFDGPCSNTKPILVSSKLWSPAELKYVS